MKKQDKLDLALKNIFAVEDDVVRAQLRFEDASRLNASVAKIVRDRINIVLSHQLGDSKFLSY